MPHVIYLHSALTNGRTPVRDARERARVLSFERLDVILALGLAGVVNMAMLAVAAKLFHGTGHTGVSTIEQAHAGFAKLRSAAAPRWRSRLRCSPPARPPRASAPTPARS